jgi:hypothetical protein
MSSAALLTNPRLPVGLESVCDSIGDGRHLTPASAARVLAAADLAARDLLAWAEFGHPVRHSYGRRLVASGPRFELMVMSWLPGDYSAIHDHGFTEWGAVRYFGHADHVIFRERAGILGIESRATMRPGSVCAVDHDLIHLMGNAGDTPFLSLHLYGLEGPRGGVTADARIFDLFEQRIQRTDGGVFYCLPEAGITRREACPAADLETTRLHDRLMLARVERILAAGGGDASLRERARDLRARLARLDLAASGARP